MGPDPSDDIQSWPKEIPVIFDGLTYDQISAAPTDAKARLDWLENGTWWNPEFHPQPYSQLAKVLRDMGHGSDARLVLEKREELLRRDELKRMRTPPDPETRSYPVALWTDIRAAAYWSADKALKYLIGYGHRPFKSLWALTFLIIAAILPAHFAWEEGSMAPNSAVVQNSSGWAEYLTAPNPADAWSAKGAPGQDWETFNPYAYGFDVVIPIINFGQTEAWAPSTNREWWGDQLYWLRWVLGAMGWIVTALGAAAITGLIRRD